MSLANFLLANAPFTLPHHLYSFVEGQTPLSTNRAVFSSLAGYLALIFGIQAALKHRPSCAHRINPLFQVYNLMVSTGSLLLLVLLLEEIAPLIWRDGIFASICAETSWTPRMEFYYMVNYYFKYIEFLDTVFLAFKQKPLAFFHVFHHSATALLCYSQLLGRTSISWTVIVLNLAIHVLMYYYYYATAGGARLWLINTLLRHTTPAFFLTLATVLGLEERYSSAAGCSPLTSAHEKDSSKAKRKTNAVSKGSAANETS
ncbi:elongation of fatty acids protein [Favolaschia claudopus]|uniref:Elongation of fatty acids protein n=1 Tax=Favolaschia claudopus TaxID=2862362 RepID=A0AAW0DP08_9AGAR